MDSDTVEQSEMVGLTAMPTERLEAEILAWGANISAAMSRWLAWIAEYDRRQGWRSWEALSMAHWLQWRAGIAQRTAGEYIRVAHALQALPLVSAEFAGGRLSYSQVRAITRVACPQNEDGLVQIAQNSTASQLERVCSALRRTGVLNDADEAEHRRRRRGVWCRTEDDGSVTYTVRLEPEEAALVGKALDRALVQSEATVAQRKADAFIDIAESFLATGFRDRSGADRTSVVIHLDANVVADLVPGTPDDGTRDGARCHVENGGSLASTTARRLACNATWTLVAEGAHGQTVAVSAPIRSVPGHIERAIRRRDRHCRVPGCERVRLDVHHIRYRSHGGSHDPANLIAVCAHHHQGIHDGRLTITHDGEDRVVFTHRQWHRPHRAHSHQR